MAGMRLHILRRSGPRTGLPTLAATGMLLLGLAGGAAAQSAGASGVVTFTKDVAPILQAKCQECHRPGTAAPMSLLTYQDAKRYASLIKFKVQRREMPPWFIDKTVGIQTFKNDQSLNDEQIATVVKWVDQGAIEGNPADLPPAKQFPPADKPYWEYENIFGRPPDLVVKSTPYLLDAKNGLNQWPDPVTKVEGLSEARWIRAIEVRPGSPDAAMTFHHGDPSLVQDGERTGLIASALGKRGELYPDDAGKLIKPGAEIEWGLHFHPIDHPITAVMELGFWFYPKGEKPKYETPGEVQFRADQSTGAVAGFPGHSKQIARRADLLIAPNSKAMYQGTYVLQKPARITSIRPHMHYRGMYQILEAVYPDGHRETIDKVNYDQDWQLAYQYTDDTRPLLPKGTVLIITSIFDNTKDNPLNPDPDQWVVAGSRTVDEMSHLWVGLTWLPQADFEMMVQQRKEKEGQKVAQQGSDVGAQQ